MLAGMQALLNDVAIALSSIVLIYAQGVDSATSMAIPAMELADGRAIPPFFV